MKLNPRRVEESLVEACYMVLPSHTNALGSIFGGTIMSWIDITAAICAQRHSCRNCVTASVDAVNFNEVIEMGDTVVCRARIVFTGRSSMVIRVEVDAENPLKGAKRRCLDAMLTFVALDENRKPVEVPPLQLETDDQKQDFKEAERRRAALIEQKKREAAQKTKT